MLEGLGRTQQDLLNALLHHASGMSIDELAEQLAVTRTAIRQHLAALERDGLVLRGETRPTGRRPEQLYRLTDHAKEQFPRQYQMLASVLIDEVAGIIGPEALATLMRSMGRKLALDRESQVVDEARIVQHMNQAGYQSEVFFRSSNEIAHQVEMIAGMSEGNSKVIGQTASTTDDLSALAGKLSQSVDRFRL